jgi:hypothetical protein
VSVTRAPDHRAGVSKSRPFSLPLFSGVRGSGILRTTSPWKNSRKFAYAPADRGF